MGGDVSDVLALALLCYSKGKNLTQSNLAIKGEKNNLTQSYEPTPYGKRAQQQNCRKSQ